MNALEVSQRLFDAWNRHDADAAFALYTEDATYHSPRFDHPLKGKAIGDWVKTVLTAYPDLRFEVISRGDTGEAWSPPNLCYTAPTPVRLWWAAPHLPVAPSPIR